MSQLKDYLEIIDFQQKERLKQEPPMNADHIKELYKEIAKEQAPAWRIHDLPPVPGNRFPSPRDIPHLMEHFASQIQYSKGALHPVELGAMAYKRIVDIAPFDADNEKLAQAVMNQLLSGAGYPVLSLPLCDQEGYDEALLSSRLKKDMDIFSEFAAKILAKSI